MQMMDLQFDDFPQVLCLHLCLKWIQNEDLTERDYIQYRGALFMKELDQGLDIITAYQHIWVK